MSPEISGIAGFERATTTPKNESLVLANYGRAKHGKTNFALTMPGPIAVFDFNFGLKGVIEKFANNKPIYVRDFNFDKTSNDAEEFTNVWLDFYSHYTECLLSGAIRSIVIDTATEMYELARLYKLGRLTKVQPFNYGEVNLLMDTIVQQASHSGKNVIFNHKVGMEYIGDSKTGDIEMKGYSGMAHAVEMVCRVFRDIDDDGRVRHNLRIEDSRFDSSHAGLVLSGSMCDFPTLASIVFGKDPSTWR